MTSRQLIKQSAVRLREAGIPDPEVDASLLLSHLTGKPALSLRLDMDTQLSEDTLAAFDSLLQRRLTREPLQYMLGTQPFCGRMFYVDSRVLIPRPETELLAERAVAALNDAAQRHSSHPAALDLCCGSGCLAVTMKLACPDADVHAADLSGDALDVTQLNAAALQADVTLHQGDLFDAIGEGRFDVIVSNPPYIPREECRTLQPEVLMEPMMALDGGDDGLDFYSRIAQGAPAHLIPGGVILLEVGAGQAEDVAQLLTDAGLTNTAIHNDFNDIGRMVEAHRPTMG